MEIKGVFISTSKSTVNIMYGSSKELLLGHFVL